MLTIHIFPDTEYYYPLWIYDKKLGIRSSSIVMTGYDVYVYMNHCYTYSSIPSKTVSRASNLLSLFLPLCKRKTRITRNWVCSLRDLNTLSVKSGIAGRSKSKPYIIPIQVRIEKAFFHPVGSETNVFLCHRFL